MGLPLRQFGSHSFRKFSSHKQTNIFVYKPFNLLVWHIGQIINRSHISHIGTKTMYVCARKGNDYTFIETNSLKIPDAYELFTFVSSGYCLHYCFTNGHGRKIFYTCQTTHGIFWLPGLHRKTQPLFYLAYQYALTVIANSRRGIYTQFKGYGDDIWQPCQFHEWTLPNQHLWMVGLSSSLLRSLGLNDKSPCRYILSTLLFYEWYETRVSWCRGRRVVCTCI